MKRLLLLVLFPCLLFCGCRRMPEANYYVTIQGKIAKVEIAADDASRIRGLMYRESLPPDTGMLFIFPDEAVRNFWMKNTSVPLSIAYISGQGTIVNIKDMTPFSTDTVTSAAPAKYALEMIQGWFDKNGIKSGQTVTMSPGIEKDYLENREHE
jgi:uncharacterized protein